MNILKNQWFSIAIIGVILTAYLANLFGLFISEPISKPANILFITVIFFLSGVTVESSKLLRIIGFWQAHLFIQSISFIAYPAVIIAFATVFGLANLQNPVYLGFLILACIPTTISSCVVFTKNAGGNEECALFNATLGNLIGIFITPALIFLLVGERIEIDALGAIKNLFVLIVLPFSLGVFSQHKLNLKLHNVDTKTISNLMILGIMFLAFLNTFRQGTDLNLTQLLYILLVAAALKLSFVLMTWHLSGYINSLSDIHDRKCITITATQKTMALGLSIIAIIFSDNPNMAVITLPLIAYHTIVLFIDGIMVGKMIKLE